MGSGVGFVDEQQCVGEDTIHDSGRAICIETQPVVHGGDGGTVGSGGSSGTIEHHTAGCSAIALTADRWRMPAMNMH